MSNPDGNTLEHSRNSSAGRGSLTALVLMLLVIVVVPALFGRTRSPEPFDQSVADRFEASAPDTVYLGNSLLDTRIDVDYLNELTGSTAASLAIDGTAPGIWLLQLQNIVAASENPPERVFIFFHDDLITRRIFFTGSEDRGLVERLTRSDKSGFGAVSTTSGSIGDRIRDAFVTLYPITKLNSYQTSSPISSIGARTTGITGDEFIELNDAYFAFANKRDEAASIQQPKFHGDFDSKIDSSFLPAIIDVTESIDTDLVIIRVAARPGPDGSPNESASLAKYSVDLAAYLAANNIRYIDMIERVGDGALDAAMYYDGYHIKYRFRGYYTELFAELLRSEIDLESSDRSGANR